MAQRSARLLFDLLQSNGPDVRAYDVARTRDLFDELVTPRAAIRFRRRSRARDCASQRGPCSGQAPAGAASRRPRVSGRRCCRSSAPSGGWTRRYAALASEAADELAPPAARRPACAAGRRAGGRPALHAAIESHGAVVVAEAGPWGSGAAGEDVRSTATRSRRSPRSIDRDAIGPRTPVARCAAGCEHLLDDVDAVVVSLPPDDTVFGWDYPALRDLAGGAASAARLPVAAIRACRSTPADHERSPRWSPRRAARQEARHG